jgi:hypothetical protein
MPGWVDFGSGLRDLIPHFNKPVKRNVYTACNLENLVRRGHLYLLRAHVGSRHQPPSPAMPRRSTARGRRLAEGRLSRRAGANGQPGRAERERRRGSVSGDEFVRLESAADALNRAGIDAELRGDLAHARPSGSCQSVPNALFQLRSYPRPTQTFPLAPGPR